MIQIDKSDWDEIAEAEAICKLPMGVEELEKLHTLAFFSYVADAGAAMNAAVVKIGNFKYWLCCPDEQKTQSVCVNIRSFETDSLKALEALLCALNLTGSDLLWQAENLGPAKWVLSRLDDNGNEIEMIRFLHEHAANRIRDRYQKKGHKQDYYVHREI